MLPLLLNKHNSKNNTVLLFTFGYSENRIYTFLDPVVAVYLIALENKSLFEQFDVGIFADGSLLVSAIRLSTIRKASDQT